MKPKLILALGASFLSLVSPASEFTPWQILRPILSGTVKLPAARQETKMSKDLVLGVAKAIDAAANKKDITEIFRYLAPDFTLTVKRQDGLILMKLLREQYRTYLMNMFAPAGGAKTAHGDISVEVAPDGNTAFTRFETLQYEDQPNGEKLASANSEVDAYTLREGKILLSHAEITVAGGIPAEQRPK
jgi:hypothetical protein